MIIRKKSPPKSTNWTPLRLKQLSKIFVGSESGLLTWFMPSKRDTKMALYHSGNYMYSSHSQIYAFVALSNTYNGFDVNVMMAKEWDISLLTTRGKCHLKYY